MNRKQINIFKILLLLCGLGIIVAAYFMFKPEGELSAELKFMWINIGVMYAVLFGPLFLSNLSLNNVDKKIPSLVMNWIMVCIFEVTAIVLLIVVLKTETSVRLAVLIEAIILFVGLIFIFWGYLGNTQIQNVAAREENELSKILQIRSALQTLNIKCSGMSDEFSTEKKLIEKYTEEARYISPVSTPEAVSLENQMFTCVAQIDAAADMISSGADSQNFKSQIANLGILFSQRKLLKK